MDPVYSARIQLSQNSFNKTVDQLKVKLAEIKLVSNIETKKAGYEQVFYVIKQEMAKGPLSNDFTVLVFELLNDYAKDTCYGQESLIMGSDGNSVDDEEGFRKSACLLELSVMKQLLHIGLVDGKPFSCITDTLNGLTASLHYDKGQKSVYFDAINQLAVDPQAVVVAANTHGIQPLLAQTLINLCFSYQNIGWLTDEMTPEKASFHKKLQALTVAVIGNNLEMQEDFGYNRCRFIVDLDRPNDIAAQIASYEPVLALTQEAYKDKPLARDSRIAQIENMRGVLLARSMVPDALAKAEPFFQRAFAIREPLLGKFPTEKENNDQYFLLCNIRCGLVKCCLAKNDLSSAVPHAQALGQFLQFQAGLKSGNAYSNGYRDIIQQVLQAIAKNPQ